MVVSSTTHTRKFVFHVAFPFAEKNEWKTDDGSETRRFWEWIGGRSNNIQEPDWYERTVQQLNTDFQVIYLHCLEHADQNINH